MSSIISSLTDLAKSLVEVVWSLFTTAGDLAQKTVEFVLRFFTGALNLVIEFFKGLVDLAGGIVQLVRVRGEVEELIHVAGADHVLVLTADDGQLRPVGALGEVFDDVEALFQRRHRIFLPALVGRQRLVGHSQIPRRQNDGGSISRPGRNPKHPLAAV